MIQPTAPALWVSLLKQNWLYYCAGEVRLVTGFGESRRNYVFSAALLIWNAREGPGLDDDQDSCRSLQRAGCWCCREAITFGSSVLLLFAFIKRYFFGIPTTKLVFSTFPKEGPLISQIR